MIMMMMMTMRLNNFAEVVQGKNNSEQRSIAAVMQMFTTCPDAAASLVNLPVRHLYPTRYSTSDSDAI